MSNYSLPFEEEIEITSEYGQRKHPIKGEEIGHNGIDFAVENVEVKLEVEARC